MTSLSQSFDRLQFCVRGSTLFHPEVKNDTFIALNILVHAETIAPPLPPTRGEPAEQDATRRDSLAQRQAETNNAAPRLEAVIPTEL